MTNFPSISTIKNEKGVINNYDCGCLIHRSSCGAYLIFACNLHNAASNLLLACKHLVEDFEDGSITQQSINEAKQAIASTKNEAVLS